MELVVGENLLEGDIRTEIGRMINLTHYVVGPSRMQGSIPSLLFTLPNLQVLHLHNSAFSGTLSDAQFGKLSDTLRELWLQNNKFSGPIPIGAIQSMSNLEQLLLFGNSLLRGSIPLAVCERRGYGSGMISQLQVDCSISCPQGCCMAC